ncbi:MAG TPA: MarR family winged helix-turn-helix transcriptional regulator [Acidimicrobiales bacterium]|jgi:DNA-binding MarR family transcriptional regulator
MSTEGRSGGRAEGLSVDDGVRAMILLTPRLVARTKRLPVPEQLRSFSLTPRHLSLLAYLLYDGAMGVNELARRLEVAPTTVSLMVGDLSRQGILERREDDADRRRTIVSIAEAHRPAIEAWLAAGARAWRVALEPLTPAERRLVVETLRTYEREANRPT